MLNKNMNELLEKNACLEVDIIFLERVIKKLTKENKKLKKKLRKMKKEDPEIDWGEIENLD